MSANACRCKPCISVIILTWRPCLDSFSFVNSISFSIKNSIFSAILSLRANWASSPATSLRKDFSGMALHLLQFNRLSKGLNFSVFLTIHILILSLNRASKSKMTLHSTPCLRLRLLKIFKTLSFRSFVSRPVRPEFIASEGKFLSTFDSHEGY